MHLMQPQGETTDSLAKELTRTKKELSVLLKISQQAVAGYLEFLLHLIVNLTRELAGCDICSIMILDADHHELVVRAAVSLDEEYLKTSPVKVDQSLCGQVFLEGRPCQWPDVTKEPLFHHQPMARRLGLKSLLSIPIMIRFQPIGVMNFYTVKTRYFSDEEIAFFQSMANQAAVAIERETLVREVTVSRRNLEERKMVEKAKGILMKRKNLSEEEAWQRLRMTSMSARKSMAEVSKAVILTESI